MDKVVVNRDRSEMTFAVMVTLMFVLVCGFAIAHHEMWRDEAQAWLLARDAAGIPDLLTRTQYERHPLLWHMLLYPISRLTHRPEAMQALNLVFAAVGVFLVTYSAPFPRWARAVFCFGYFPLYEYGVLARNYAVGTVFLFAATALFSQRQKHPWAFGGLLALAAHTSAPALIVAVALAGAAAVDALLSRNQRSDLVSAGKSCMVAAVAILVAAIQMAPPADAAYARGQGWTMFLDSLRFEQVLGLFAKALLPISTSRPFWGHFWLDDVSHHVAPAITVALLPFVLLHLRRQCSALTAFVLGNFGLMAFFYAKTVGAIRHHGFLYLTLVAALWIARASAVADETSTRRRSTTWSAAVFTVLAVQLVAGVMAVWVDRSAVFSGGLAAARLLEARGLADLPVVGHVDVVMPPVIAYADIPGMYFPRGERFGSYTIWDRRREMSVTDDDVFRQSVDQARRHNSRIALVLSHASPVAVQWGAQEVGCVSADVVENERYCLYLLDPP